ncbi:MAG: carbonic anhydrase [Candidatus Bathyarchaeia archaeon]
MIGMGHGKFATVVNCMDGRTQLPVIEYMRKKFAVDYVDVITEPGPVKALAEPENSAQAESIRSRLRISAEKHGSTHFAVVAHHDCAGNPVDKETQIAQIQRALETVRSWGFKGTVLGLWVDENWSVHEVE